MKISLLIPFYNEENQIPITLAAVYPIMDSLNMDYELILVDDGSRDRTWPVIEAAGQKDSRIIGLHFSRNFGKEAAIELNPERMGFDRDSRIEVLERPPMREVPEYRKKFGLEG